MKMTNLLIVMMTALLIWGCQDEQESKPNAALETAIETQLDTLLANPEFQLISCGVINQEAVQTFHKGKTLDGKTLDDETLYEIASLTKTFTGTLLAYALAESKVDIDDDIRQYLPDSFPNLEYEGQPISFRHLVTHQSGLPNMFPNVEGLFDNANWDELPFRINELQAGFSKIDFFEALNQVQLDTVPGTKFQYSNAGANLLGYLLEELYGKPYDELLQEKILGPLKMTNTHILREKMDLSKLAYGHNENGIKMPLRAQKAMNAEGGIISNTLDMTKYMQFHLNEEDKVVALAHQHLWGGKFGDFEAGLFWQINKNGDQPDRVFQNGGAFGTSSWLTLIPEQEMAIFLVTNVSGPNVHQKLSETADKIIEEVNESRR